MTFEVCCNSVKSALAAQLAGAHRVELCGALSVGGLTPSYGEILLARELLQIKLHVLIRPRAGDFTYDMYELKSMLEDIELCRKAGVDGVVTGCLCNDGTVDVGTMNALMVAAEGMSVTFHRAFDLCSSPEQALEDIIGLGCERVLTSGLSSTAEQGMDQIRKLQQQAAGRISIMAGAGINEHNIQRIAASTNVTEFHFSAGIKVESDFDAQINRVLLGVSKCPAEHALTISSEEKIRRVIASVNC